MNAVERVDEEEYSSSELTDMERNTRKLLSLQFVHSQGQISWYPIDIFQ